MHAKNKAITEGNAWNRGAEGSYVDDISQLLLFIGVQGVANESRALHGHYGRCTNLHL